MDGSIDIKLIATLAGILVSMAGTDKLENDLSTQIQRLDVIAKMMSPEVMERKAREMATIIARVEVLERTQIKIEGRVGLNGKES